MTENPEKLPDLVECCPGFDQLITVYFTGPTSIQCRRCGYSLAEGTPMAAYTAWNKTVERSNCRARCRNLADMRATEGGKIPMSNEAAKHRYYELQGVASNPGW